MWEAITTHFLNIYRIKNKHLPINKANAIMNVRKGCHLTVCPQKLKHISTFKPPQLDRLGRFISLFPPR